MKTLKLIFVFIAVLGVTFGAFYLKQDGGSVKLTTIGDSTYETYRQQFEKDWEQKGDWDSYIFDNHCDIVNQLSTRYQTQPLKDLNTATAIGIVHKRIFEEWKDAACHKAVVDKYMKAIDMIEAADENAKSNTKVVLTKRVYSTYKIAYELASRKIGLKPHFNGKSWNSYASYSGSIMSQKNALTGNGYYKEYLSDISAISNGLNSIPEKLTKGKELFYKSLAYQIMEYFEDIPNEQRTRQQLNELRSARNRYEEEYLSNSSLNTLAKDFLNDVERNENNGY